MTNRATIEHSGIGSELYAKVVFDLYMNDFSFEKLKTEWDKFKKDVDDSLKAVKVIKPL